MNVYHFDLFRSALVLECHANGTEFGLRDLVGELEVPAAQPDKPVTRLVLKQENFGTAVKDHEFFLESEIVPFGAFVFGKNTTGWSMHQPEAFTAYFEFEGKSCEIAFMPECPKEKIAMASAFAIDHALGVGGQAMIHAASLDIRDGSGRIAIHAKSGTGKTTLALALAMAGYRVCSDDASVIAPGNNGDTNIWGLPRNPKIFPATITMINAIEPMILNSISNHRGKVVLSRSKMRNAGLLAELTPRPLRAIISLTRDSNVSCAWNQQEKYDGLMSLVDDNITFGPQGFFPGHDHRLDQYTGMLASAVPFRLNINNDIDEAVEAVNQLVQTLP